MDLQRRGGEYGLEDWTVIIWTLTTVGENTADFLQLAHHVASCQARIFVLIRMSYHVL